MKLEMNASDGTMTEVTMKTETRHTPGPWTLKANGPAWNLISAGQDDHFAILLGMNHNEPGELDANAKLIASAPDLLVERDSLKAQNAELVEALEDAQQWLLSGNWDSIVHHDSKRKSLENIKAALAKVKK